MQSKIDLLPLNIVKILMMLIKQLFASVSILVGNLELINQRKLRILHYIMILQQPKQIIHGKYHSILENMQMLYILLNLIMFTIINVIQQLLTELAPKNQHLPQEILDKIEYYITNGHLNAGQQYDLLLKEFPQYHIKKKICTMQFKSSKELEFMMNLMLQQCFHTLWNNVIKILILLLQHD